MWNVSVWDQSQTAPFHLMSRTTVIDPSLKNRIQRIERGFSCPIDTHCSSSLFGEASGGREFGTSNVSELADRARLTISKVQRQKRCFVQDKDAPRQLFVGYPVIHLQAQGVARKRQQ